MHRIVSRNNLIFVFWFAGNEEIASTQQWRRKKPSRRGLGLATAMQISMVDGLANHLQGLARSTGCGLFLHIAGVRVFIAQWDKAL